MSSIPQPLVAYPHSTSTNPSLSSKGSYGAVFVVLAVIAVVAAVTCIIGRLCARRLCQPASHAYAIHDMEHGLGAAAKVIRGDATKIHKEMKGMKADDKIVGPDFGAKASK